MRKKYLRLVRDGASGADEFSHFHSAGGTRFQTLHFLMDSGESGESVQNLQGVSHYEHFAAICKAAALFWCMNRETCRKALLEHTQQTTSLHLWVSGMQACSSLSFGHSVYVQTTSPHLSIVATVSRNILNWKCHWPGHKIATLHNSGSIESFWR